MANTRTLDTLVTRNTKRGANQMSKEYDQQTVAPEDEPHDFRIIIEMTVTHGNEYETQTVAHDLTSRLVMVPLTGIPKQVDQAMYESYVRIRDLIQTRVLIAELARKAEDAITDMRKDAED